MLKLKYILIVAFISSFSIKAFTQDIIFFKDGTKDTVKVLEIGLELISYKKFNRQNGPLYKVEKEKVILIEYEDGTIEQMPVVKKEKKENSLPIFLKKRNILTLNTFALFITNVHIGYENISASGNFGIKLNVSLSPFLGLEDGLALIGTDFNFYPFGQKSVSYFLGPSFRIGAFDEEAFTALVFNNGFAYNAKSGFYLGGQLGIGPGLHLGEGPIPYGFFMLNIGGRF
jgi:hypothetical protein